MILKKGLATAIDYTPHIVRCITYATVIPDRIVQIEISLLFSHEHNG